MRRENWGLDGLEHAISESISFGHLEVRPDLTLRYVAICCLVWGGAVGFTLAPGAAGLKIKAVQASPAVLDLVGLMLVEEVYGAAAAGLRLVPLCRPAELSPDCTVSAPGRPLKRLLTERFSWKMITTWLILTAARAERAHRAPACLDGIGPRAGRRGLGERRGARASGRERERERQDVATRDR